MAVAAAVADRPHRGGRRRGLGRLGGHAGADVAGDLDQTGAPVGLERSFKELADRGFCVTWGEWLPELCGVGAPLRNSDGTAAYAINASAPIYQISRDRLEADWGPRLVKIARDIRTGMAAQPSTSTQAPAAMRPATTNGNGHRPPMSAMARR